MFVAHDLVCYSALDELGAERGHKVERQLEFDVSIDLGGREDLVAKDVADVPDAPLPLLQLSDVEHGHLDRDWTIGEPDCIVGGSWLPSARIRRNIRLERDGTHRLNEGRRNQHLG